MKAKTNLTMLCDYYQLTMANGYFKNGMKDQICYFDLFFSCDKDNCTLFLVLSVVIVVVLPFLVFACRKKDLGMPPRKVQVPVAPWQPAPEPPVWQNAVAPQLEEEPAPAEEAAEEPTEE